MSDFAYPLHEECGVFGIYDRAGTEDVAAAAYSALYALQHRGQESCGIAVNDDGVIQGHRDLGLVNEVFTPAVLGSLSTPTAHMATGHVRYATAGSRVRANAQPMIVRHGRGTMALCHNGNLTNALELRRQLENEGAIFHGSSDTEVICYLITRNRLRMGSIETAISKTMDVLEGAYSLVIMSATKLIAVRDPGATAPCASAPCPAAATSLPARAVRWMLRARPCCGTWSPARSSLPTPRPVSCGASRITAAARTPRCACSSSSISPARTASSRAARCTRPASRQAGSWHRSTLWRPMWSSACRIPVWMRRSATRRRAASPTASASSRINTSAAPLSRAARSSAKTACVSS